MVLEPLNYACIDLFEKGITTLEETIRVCKLLSNSLALFRYF